MRRVHDRRQGIYTIGIAARLLGLHEHTLRFYEDEGLIQPQRDPKSNRRLYSEQDLQWIQCIRELIHHAGLTAKGIRRLLDLVPCWQIKHCPEEQWRTCAPNLNIPNMAMPADVAVSLTGAEAESKKRVRRRKKRKETKPLEVELIYGVREFGAIMPCMKCVKAERLLRKIAQRLGGKINIIKREVDSPDVERYGIVLTPAIVINGEMVAMDSVPSESELERFIRERLASAG